MLYSIRKSTKLHIQLYVSCIFSMLMLYACSFWLLIQYMCTHGIQHICFLNPFPHHQQQSLTTSVWFVLVFKTKREPCSANSHKCVIVPSCVLSLIMHKLCKLSCFSLFLTYTLSFSCCLVMWKVIQCYAYILLLLAKQEKKAVRWLTVWMVWAMIWGSEIRTQFYCGVITVSNAAVLFVENFEFMNWVGQ